MEVSFSLDGIDIDVKNMKKEEQIRLADELNMQGLIPAGYRVVRKNKDGKKTA